MSIEKINSAICYVKWLVGTFIYFKYFKSLSFLIAIDSSTQINMYLIV